MLKDNLENMIRKPGFQEKSYLSKLGFTLIELLIVMVIIGSLGSIVVVTYPASQQRARDTRRRSDLKQYQTALETYASRNNGLYPIRTTAVKPSTLCGAGNPLSFLSPSNCPNDPKDGLNVCSGSPCQYQYMSGGSSYTLWATLEKPANPTNKYFVVCSSGRTYEGSAYSCP